MKKKIYYNTTDYVEVNVPKKGILQEVASKRRSFDFFSSSQYLVNPDEVLRKTGKSIQCYNEIKRDSHVKSCLRTRKAGVRKMLWDIDKGKTKSKHSKFIISVFNKLPLYKIIGDILEAPLFGYKPLEVMWHAATINNREAIVPYNVKGKPNRWFVFDDDGSLKFRSKENLWGEYLPPRKFLCPTQEADDDNPYGFADLSLCFWWVTFKKGDIKFWLYLLEKYGMPFIAGKVPRGTKENEIDDLLDKLDNMIQDAVAVITDDQSIEIHQTASKGNSSDMHKDFLFFCNSEISKALLGQTLTTEVQEKGAYSTAKVHLEVKGEIVKDDSKLVEETLNKLIEWIIQINFGEAEEYPKFILYDEKDVDLPLAERDETLNRMGIKFTPKYIKDAYFLDDDDFTLQESKLVIDEEQNFQEKKDEISEEQKAIEKLTEFFDDEKLQEQIEPTLNPLFTCIKEGGNYNECMEELVQIFPKMKTNELEEILAKAMFISETLGRLEK